MIKMYEKNGIAILIPSEYDRLRDEMRVKHKILSDFLLYTGVRYTEAQKIVKEWYQRDKKIIHIPHSADKKVKRTTPDRYIYLSTIGKIAVDRYFEEGINFPTYVAFDEMLKKKGEKIELAGRGKISVKMFRKTWECWLVSTYREEVPLIAMSQGHSEIVAMNHYLNIPFSGDEKRDIKERVSGWGE